jgi:hypothetical protein
MNDPSEHPGTTHDCLVCFGVVDKVFLNSNLKLVLESCGLPAQLQGFTTKEEHANILAVTHRAFNCRKGSLPWMAVHCQQSLQVTVTRVTLSLCTSAH